MKTKSILFIAALFCLHTAVEAQSFRHLDLALELGTTGIGIDASSPINDIFSLRAGLTVMPALQSSRTFTVDVDEQKFDKLNTMMTSITGMGIDNKISMLAQTGFFNAKLLLDIRPFNDKRWHISPGLYWGSSEIARIYNSYESMTTLYAANMYNTMYRKANDDEAIIEIGEFALYPSDEMLENYFSYGEVGVYAGKRKSDGSDYKITPDEHCRVSAKVLVNAFKPYLGFGYGSNLTSDPEQTWHYSFDCGLLFWGGSPSCITHDGTDITHDLTDYSTRIGRYVNLLNTLKAYPVISLRISRTIF